MLECIYRILLKFFKNKEPYIEIDISGITILEMSSADNLSNVKNYLLHHYCDENVEFEPITFDEPVYVKYKLFEETYRIALISLMNKKITSAKGDKILCASVNDVNITDLVNEFYGPDRNFYNDNTDVLKLDNNKHFIKYDKITILNFIGLRKDIHLSRH